MASRFRAKGGSSALLILTPIIILSVTGPNAAANWGILPPISTPTQALLLMTATACMVIGAISRQVLKATVDAMEASQAKTRFVSMLHHELRTPLNAILGFSELMRMQKIRDIDEAMAPFENIHASGQRLLAMIEGLLNQADQGASAFELNKLSLNLKELIGGVVEELQPEMSAFRFPVTISIPDELNVEADARAMKQILMVLLAYPLRFVTPWTEVTAVAQQVGTDTVLEINSRGLVGAANDDRDRLELQLVTALALAHGARLSIHHADRDQRQARLTFFATHAAA
jgi:signal transduction histidine kinase